MHTLISVVVAVVMLVGHARSAECTSADAPYGFYDQKCDADASAEPDGNSDTCWRLSSSELRCNLGLNGATQLTTIIGLSEYGVGSADYTFYGVDGMGDLFCCTFNEGGGGGAVTAVTVYGTEYADDVILTDLYDVSPEASGMIIYAYTYQDEDALYGSATESSVLYGCDHDDDIYAGYIPDGGNNALVGGGGSDTILSDDSGDAILGGDASGPCDDTDESDYIFGYGGDDQIWGDIGHDVIHGGPGNDELHGAQGTDELYGNEGDDLICGDQDGLSNPGDDEMEGGDGDDILWGGDGTDTALGGAHYDQCSAETETSCTHIDDIPEECE